MAVYEKYVSWALLSNLLQLHSLTPNRKNALENYVPGLYAISVDNRITAKEAQEEDAN